MSSSKTDLSQGTDANSKTDTKTDSLERSPKDSGRISDQVAPLAEKIPHLVLASASPRRRMLLADAGYRFDVVVAHADEPAPTSFSNPDAYVTHTAWLKAQAAHGYLANLEQSPREPAWVLAADTVAVANKSILGKPTDRDDAARILRLLHGSEHQTITGVCLWLARQQLALLIHEVTMVRMKKLTAHELDRYLDSGSWRGKAGAYGIQDDNDPFVETIQGSFTNVVGLPMERLEKLFQTALRLESFAPMDKNVT